MRHNVAGLVRTPEKTALLVIDMQNDFVIPGAPVAAPGAPEIMPLIADLASRSRAKGFPVVFTQEMHRADGSDFGIELEFEPPHCLEGTPGLDIVDDLAPEPGDRLIRNKRRYDAFLGTDLDFVLRGAGAENLIVTGVCTDVCVISTVQHARNLDYRCFVAADAVAGTSPERHAAALLCMEHVFANVGSGKEIAELFQM
ncbi:MAG TPA: isochorismatase family cysteine hydrolase [Streptosporangiaceae bacterium]|nr:isochorismatase family cysteine hydrolase [Streptosporangiaceae bacterium]